MSLTKNELYLLKEVFTKVNYDELNERYVIHLEDYIKLNLTKVQLKLLEQMCKENNIELETTPKMLTQKETSKLFSEYNKIKEKLSLNNNKETKSELEQKLINIRNKLIEGHMHYVYKIISELDTDNLSHEDKEDLYQDIYQILVESIDIYDESKYPSFNNFFKRQALSIGLKENNNESIDEFIDSLSENKDLPIPQEYIDDNIDDEIFRRISKDTVMNIIDFLPPRRKKILMLYYGLGNEVPHTQDEIAKIMGVNKQRISSIILECLRKLRRYPYKHILLELYNGDSSEIGNKNENKTISRTPNDGRTHREIIYIENEYFKKTKLNKLIKILNQMPENQRILLTLYYGIEQPAIEDIEIISRKIGLAKTDFHKERKKALTKFKQFLAQQNNLANKEEEYINEYMLYQYLNNLEKNASNKRKK